MKKLFGVVTAMVTPFNEADRVNVTVLRKMVDFLIGSGINQIGKNKGLILIYF